MTLLWHQRAVDSLADISNDLARDDAAKANALELRIRAAVEQLGQFHGAGTVGRVKGTREVPVAGHPYVIVFRPQGQDVQVLALQHTTRQWPE